MDQNVCIKLIEAYKNYPILWNPRDKLYHNKTKREDAWREISAALDLSAADLKSKMKTLMGSYRSEKSRERKSQVTGSGTEEVYRSKWFAYHYLSFLNDKDTPVDTLDTMENTESHELQTEEGGSASPASSATLQTPTTSSSQQTKRKYGNKRKQLVDPEPESDVLEDALQLLRSSTDIASDPYYVYGQHIANELRKYDPSTLSYVKRAISDILFEADVGTIFYRYRTNPMPSFTGSQNQPPPLHVYTPSYASTHPSQDTPQTMVSPCSSSASDQPSTPQLNTQSSAASQSPPQETLNRADEGFAEYQDL